MVMKLNITDGTDNVGFRAVEHLRVLSFCLMRRTPTQEKLLAMHSNKTRTGGSRAVSYFDQQAKTYLRQQPTGLRVWQPFCPSSTPVSQVDYEASLVRDLGSRTP